LHAFQCERRSGDDFDCVWRVKERWLTLSWSEVIRDEKTKVSSTVF